jgi:hypothetical protein
MDWDQRSIWAKVAGWAESQQGEGGVNKDNNCVTACFSNTLQAYGFADVEPQTWTDVEYSPTYHGYTDVGHAIAFMRAHFTNPPPVTVSKPSDIVAAIDQAAVNGYAVHCLFWSDVNAVIGGSSKAAVHDSIVVAHHGDQLVVLNVERGEEVQLSDADFRAATAGDQVGILTIFQRALPAAAGDAPMSPIDSTLAFRGDVAVWTFLTYGKPATAEQMDWWVNHAAALGAGGPEWEIEEAIAGDDTIGRDFATMFRNLYNLVGVNRQAAGGGDPVTLAMGVEASTASASDTPPALTPLPGGLQPTSLTPSPSDTPPEPVPGAVAPENGAQTASATPPADEPATTQVVITTASGDQLVLQRNDDGSIDVQVGKLRARVPEGDADRIADFFTEV